MRALLTLFRKAKRKGGLPVKEWDKRQREGLAEVERRNAEARRKRTHPDGIDEISGYCDRADLP